MLKASIEINGRSIGPGRPVFVVAEAGSNHNGNLAMALALVDAAAAAGADAVKFQTFNASRLYPRGAGTSDYLGSATPIYEIIEAMEMPSGWLPTLRERARDHGLAFISSPFHEEAVEVLAPFVDAYKIASYELTHLPLIAKVAATGKPVLLSTGAATLEEVRAGVEALRAHGCESLVVLQCTAAYPAPPTAANVRALVTMRDALDVLTGLSDHTRDPTAAPMAAAALGAVVIEKHFTLDNDLPGPDHAFAVEPAELERLVTAVRRAEAVLGTGTKEVLPVEEELRLFARRSVFATRPIRRGEPFSRTNVDVLRNGKLAPGLAPDRLEHVLRCTAARDVAPESALCDDDLALELRPASEADCELVYAWATDPETRAASFHSATISLDEHRRWFAAALRGARTLYVAEVGNVPLGLARLDSLGAGAAEIGIIIAREHRGRGFGKRTVSALIERAAATGVTRLVARVRDGNARSVSVFRRAGFTEAGEESVAGVRARRYVRGV